MNLDLMPMEATPIPTHDEAAELPSFTPNYSTSPIPSSSSSHKPSTAVIIISILLTTCFTLSTVAASPRSSTSPLHQNLPPFTTRHHSNPTLLFCWFPQMGFDWGTTRRERLKYFCESSQPPKMVDNHRLPQVIPL
ncbi:hypothetical protein ACFX1X_014980 [Malus domestica]